MVMFPIERVYISYGNSRPGIKVPKRRFIVCHDTGNPGSDAIGNRDFFEEVQPKSSAHTFIDDQRIIEIIPLDEVAYHVRYSVPTDNEIYGYNANNAAIGVELCYGGSINFWDAYTKFVWYHAYLCQRYGLNPKKDIVTHKMLDPARKIDPLEVLKQQGISFTQFLADIYRMYVSLRA
ncbi:N-acetylmuramoyl-L-alanine amidase [Ectobacillus antri]|jgi:N-acetylmuramoyl-L-alanine amidase|uniref:N-acetylmuramoyl-L-alanine amidase n=1 Tax=Ectobacillus antri TaxID=2486280 RepID=A0ABT6H290_9BACI|nr:N-acetylmuramoyl-L-alanine amidase [Ectobacillus antri]MDG4656075.1 N-acetylmuramoyl-L-alanine amidase [Ectobacillus antri]MDG5752750.1 N-acetylmuramoyl-L-alanine amidase [Ectobacillus antri]